MKKKYNIVDMFCGAGGESTGIMQAAFEKDMNVNLFAINHWERAIETHAANHPGANHLCESVEHIDPTKIIRKGKLDLLWASPECTHHSNARGGRPRSEQSRASAWVIIDWLTKINVERVIIENVKEFITWGPLNQEGKPIKKFKGQYFRAFISAMEALNYTVDWQILNCADYGDPTTRRRLFIQAVKGKKLIVWPEITHMNGAGNEFIKPWIPARDIIDWNIAGRSIFDRSKPLAEATLKRIASGIEKYWGEYAKPFLAILHGTSTVKSIDEPLSAILSGGGHHALIEPVPLIMGHQTGAKPRPINMPTHAILAQGRINLIQPFISCYHGGTDSNNRNNSIEEPLPTQDTSNRYAVVEPFILPNEGYFRGNKARSLDDPLNTVTSRGAGAIIEPLLVDYHGTGKAEPTDKPIKTIETRDRFGLLSPFVFNIGQNSAKDRAKSIDEPLTTIVTKAEHCLVQPGMYLDIRFRMLKNDELKKAQGFPESYKITGNTTEQTKQIGNAVPVNTAKALTKAVLSA
ncbi:MAG: DNA cytosine methyltransferase [Treponema sp.]|nr:DNA cytosine methyltransferase [Treponema sp.]